MLLRSFVIGGRRTGSEPVGDFLLGHGLGFGGGLLRGLEAHVEDAQPGGDQLLDAEGGGLVPVVGARAGVGVVVAAGAGCGDGAGGFEVAFVGDEFGVEAAGGAAEDGGEFGGAFVGVDEVGAVGEACGGAAVDLGEPQDVGDGELGCGGGEGGAGFDDLGFGVGADEAAAADGQGVAEVDDRGRGGGRLGGLVVLLLDQGQGWGGGLPGAGAAGRDAAVVLRPVALRAGVFLAAVFFTGAGAGALSSVAVSAGRVLVMVFLRPAGLLVR